MKFFGLVFVSALASVGVSAEKELLHKRHEVKLPADVPLEVRQSSCSGSSNSGSSSSGSSSKRELMSGPVWMDKREPHWTDMVRNMTLAPDGVVDMTSDGWAVSIASDMTTVIDEVKLSANQIAQRDREAEDDAKLIFERQSCSFNSKGRCRSIRCYNSSQCPKPQCYFCNAGSIMTCR